MEGPPGQPGGPSLFKLGCFLAPRLRGDERIGLRERPSPKIIYPRSPGRADTARVHARPRVVSGSDRLTGCGVASCSQPGNGPEGAGGTPACRPVTPVAYEAS